MIIGCLFSSMRSWWVRMIKYVNGNLLTDGLPSSSSSRGLCNLGNTCFINCCLQGLASSAKFMSYLDYIENSIDDVTEVKFTMDLKRCLTSLRHVKTRSLFSDIFGNAHNPYIVVNDLVQYRSDFAGYDQHDAHEAFQCIMNMLEEEELEDDENQPQEQEEGEVGVGIGVGAAPPINNNSIPYTGFMGSQLTCMECQTSKPPSDECFTAISLPIPTIQEAFQSRFAEEAQRKLFDKKETLVGGGPVMTNNINNFFHNKSDPLDSKSHDGLSVDDCLKVYTNGEVINSVKCDHCNKHTSAIKRMRIKTAPKALCLHISRLVYNPVRNFYDKRTNSVGFPLMLDVKEYCEKIVGEVGERKSDGNDGDGRIREEREKGMEEGEEEREANEKEKEKKKEKEKEKEKKEEQKQEQEQEKEKEKEAKNDIRVDAPMESSSLDYSYSLKAVVSHIGSAYNGHYVTYSLVNEGIDGEKSWALFSDSTVRIVSEQEVLSSEAFLLFYQKSE